MPSKVMGSESIMLLLLLTGILLNGFKIFLKTPFLKKM